MMYELCCVRFFAEYGNSVAVNFEIEKVRNTVLELVHSEFQVLVVGVELAEYSVDVFWFH